MQTILKIEDLSKAYALAGRQNHVLSQLNFEIYQKDFSVIMGASGSGKSTLLYSVSGMDKATSGKVFYKEQNICEMSEKQLAKLRHQDFGFVFQQMHLVGNLSLLENILVAGYLNKEKSSEYIEKRAFELLDKMKIRDIATHLPSQSSGGEQQRAAIARAIINSPDILFADEPTGALNRQNSDEVLDLFSELHQAGQSILMVTHDMRAALRATRILYLADGKITGELELGKYDPKKIKSRQTQLESWLTSMAW